MSDLTPASLIPASRPGAAIGLDHIGIAGADLDGLAQEFSGLGFQLTPVAEHASGRTANRCIMLRDGGYLELMAKLPGKTSITLDRFLARGPGAHSLALEVADEAAALARLHRAGITGDVSVTERDSGQPGAKARFAVIMPPDLPEGRVLLIRQLTRDLLWRPDNVVHPNRAVALTEAVYATSAPAETMTRLSRLAGRPAEPDSMGGYRIPLAGRSLPGGMLRLLPKAAAATLFPGAAGGVPLIGLTVAVEVRAGDTVPPSAAGRVVHAAGVAIRFVAMAG